MARSSSRNSLKSILPVPVLSMLTIIRLTCARTCCTGFGAVVPLRAAGSRDLLFPRLEPERAQHNLESVGVYHACRAHAVRAQQRFCVGAVEHMEAPCPSVSKRSNACLISPRCASVSVSRTVFLPGAIAVITNAAKRSGPASGTPLCYQRQRLRWLFLTPGDDFAGHDTRPLKHCSSTPLHYPLLKRERGKAGTCCPMETSCPALQQRA